MQYQTISLTRLDGVATLRLERPDQSNAMNRQLRLEMTQAARALKDDPSVRALIITGAGTRDFSSGQDTGEPVDPLRADEWMAEWGALYESVLALDIPTLSAINGFAAGGGLQVALLADVRVAAADARIVFNEINKGIPTITGAALMVPMASMSVIQDMVLSGRALDGREACAAGIVSRVYEREAFLPGIAALGATLASMSPVAVKLNKDYWRTLRGNTLAEAIAFGRKAHPVAFAALAAAKKLQSA